MDDPKKYGLPWVEHKAIAFDTHPPDEYETSLGQLVKKIIDEEMKRRLKEDG